MGPVKGSRAVRWGKNILIALDQWANAVLGGDPDETLSSRAGKNITMRARSGRRDAWYWLCRALHLLDKNHCVDAIESDEGEHQIFRR